MAIPEARQCRIEGHPDLGAVAVKNQEVEGLWGIFHPTTSGRWGGDDDVWDWTVMEPAPAGDTPPPLEPDPGPVDEPPADPPAGQE